MLGVLACSYADVLDILALLKHLMFLLCACVLDILVCLIYFMIEKLNSKNSFIEEFGFYSEAYL